MKTFRELIFRSYSLIQDKPMKIINVDSPKFYINDACHNEYELRSIMLMVAKGELSEGIVVTDIKGNTATIQSDGCLTNDLYGMDLSDELSIKLLTVNKK